MKIIIQWFEIKSLPYMSSNNSRYLRMVQIWYPFVYFDRIWPSTVYWQFIKLEFHLSVHSSICLERHLLIVRLTSQIKGNDDQTEPMIHFFNTLSANKIITILQIIFSNSFFLDFLSEIFLMVQSTMNRYWFVWWPGADETERHYLDQWWPRPTHVCITWDPFD